MKEQRLKQIWKEASGSAEGKFEMDKEKYHQVRKKTSDRIGKTLRRGFIFDIILKSIITISTIIFLIISGVDKSYLLSNSKSLIVFCFVAMFLLSAMITSAVLSIRKFYKIPNDITVVESLNRKLDFIKTTYRKFIFSSALTAPLFVFAGNMIYFHQKYGEMRFDDPVILIFLFLAFLIAYFAQIPSYNLLKRELEEAIADFDEKKAEEIQKAKIKQKRAYLILMIIGIVLLVILILLFSFL